MPKKILFINAADKSFELKDIDPSSQPFSGGEALCQFLIREDRDALALAVSDLPFFPGNKLTVGYVSPLTSLPHYSFVGGRAAEQVMALGVGAILFKVPCEDVPPWYVVIEGREPGIRVRFEMADGLPRGQRSALYWLLERELDSDWTAGSILTLGDAACHGYRSANLAVEGIYHAGRGGAGYVLGRMARALVLKGESPPAIEVLGKSHGLNESEQGGVLRHLASGGDLTHYGLINAVTAFSQDVEDYDRATELETMGGKLVELSPDQWTEIAQAA